MDAYLKSPISTDLVVIAAIFEGIATSFVTLRAFTYALSSSRVSSGMIGWLCLVWWAELREFSFATTFTWLDQTSSWGYAIALFIVASQVGVDIVKVDPLTAAEKYIEVSQPTAESRVACNWWCFTGRCYRLYPSDIRHCSDQDLCPFFLQAHLHYPTLQTVHLGYYCYCVSLGSC